MSGRAMRAGPLTQEVSFRWKHASRKSPKTPTSSQLRGRGRLLLQPVPRRRRRAAPVPHRPPPDVPARVGRRRSHRGPRFVAMDHLRPCRGRRMRLHERLDELAPQAPPSPTVPSAAWCSSTTSPTGRPSRSETVRCSTSAATVCGGSTRRMYLTAGKPVCSTTRRPARFCAAISSPRPEPSRRRPPATSWDRPAPPRTSSPPTRWPPTAAPRSAELADLDVATLALMHGPDLPGDCPTALRDLADDIDRRIAARSLSNRQPPSTTRPVARRCSRSRAAPRSPRPGAPAGSSGRNPAK